MPFSYLNSPGKDTRSAPYTRMANGILNQLNQSLALIQQDCLDAAEDLAQPNGHAAIAPATLSLAESTETNDAPQTSDRRSRRA